jgi:cellulase/cellobiase CelA1
MVTYTEQQYGGDPQRVYATGSSSGGQETNALLADYPDVFAAGSVFMGVPFTCFADAADFPPQTSKCVNGSMNKTPQVWGDAVRQAYPGFTGTRPRVQLWHGTADTLVPYSLLQEEVDQWTDVHGLSQTPTSTDQPGSGWNRQSFADAGGTVKVEAITVQGAGHVLPLSGMAAKAIAFFGLDQSNGGTTGGTADGGTIGGTTTGGDTGGTTTGGDTGGTTTGGNTGGTTGGTPPSGATCSATFTVVNAWPGGYQADVTVKNTGSSPLSGWLVTWTQPSGQTITSLWNATQGTSGSSTTARNVGYNGTVAAGATTAFGYTVSGGAPQAGMPMTCQAS